MRIFNYINLLFFKIFDFLDRKLTLKYQLTIIKSYCFFGVPVGMFLPEIIMIFVNDKYTYNYESSIYTFVIDMIVISPMIYNYIRHIRIYNKLMSKLDFMDTTDTYDIKAKYNYNDFQKGEIYKIEVDSYSGHFYISNTYRNYSIKDIINKFDVDDIKDKRRRKLNKLKSIYK